MKKIIGIVLVFCFIFLIGLFVFNRQQGVFLGDSIEVPTITPLPQPRISGEASSIDGTKKLTMQTIQQEGDTISYTFLVTEDEEAYTLFITSAKEDTYVVPSNSWSPDARQVFLIDISLFPEQILVFNVSGESFADGKQYLNVTELFGEKITQYRLDTATGWDSRGLLHIRTKNLNGSNGPSFWFDVASRSFIQLAAR